MTHSHHWQIAPANGPKALGVCAECGETREFFTCFEDTVRFNRNEVLTRLARDDLLPYARDIRQGGKL